MCLNVSLPASIVLDSIYTKALSGIDISQHMIAHSSQSFTLQNLLFQQLDIASMNFIEQFDLAAAFCSLHYVVEQKEAFLSDITDEMLKYNIAAEDGKIYLDSSLFECLVKKA